MRALATSLARKSVWRLDTKERAGHRPCADPQGFYRRPRSPKLPRHARNTVNLRSCRENAEKARYAGCASGPPRGVSVHLMAAGPVLSPISGAAILGAPQRSEIIGCTHGGLARTGASELTPSTEDSVAPLFRHASRPDC